MEKMLGYFLMMAAAVVFVANGQEVITVTNGETDGRWGPLESCPPGSRVNGYQSSHEANAPVVDDSALNTLILFCDDADATNITSTQG
jgi:hypothetical protein